jgi:predicted transcriptional regulator
MADILRVASRPTSKTQILYAANLSHAQAVKYVEMLVACGMLSKLGKTGTSEKFVITDSGQAFLSQISPRFGSISPGERSVWA